MKMITSVLKPVRGELWDTALLSNEEDYETVFIARSCREVGVRAFFGQIPGSSKRSS
jgi:hypothetical protein